MSPRVRHWPSIASSGARTRCRTNWDARQPWRRSRVSSTCPQTSCVARWPWYAFPLPSTRRSPTMRTALSPTCSRTSAVHRIRRSPTSNSPTCFAPPPRRSGRAKQRSSARTSVSTGARHRRWRRSAAACTSRGSACGRFAIARCASSAAPTSWRHSMSSPSGITEARDSSVTRPNVLIRSLLVLRGGVGVWYAGTFLAGPANDWNGMFDTLADYLLIDGALGIVVAALLYREGAGTHRKHLGTLGAMMLLDAVGRVASGYAVHHWPGIPGFPVTAVMFIALMAVFTITLGVVEAGLILEEDI